MRMSLGINRGLALNNTGGAGAFDPLSLFASTDGGWYDPSDFSTMWQDTAGTVAVTAVGQNVNRIDDKSGNGRHATVPAGLNPPVLRQDAFGFYYLEYVAASTQGLSVAFTPTTNWPNMAAAWIKASTTIATYPLAVANSASASRFVALIQSTAASNNAGIQMRGALNQITVLSGFTSGHIVIVANPRGTPDIKINKTATGAISADSDFAGSGLNTIGIGYVPRSTPIYSTGNFYGGIVLNRAFTAAEMVAVDTYLASKSPVSVLRNCRMIPLLGQSNMIGRDNDDGSVSHPAGVYQFTLTNGASAATKPLDHVNDIAGDIGLDVTFSIDFKANQSQNLVFVPYAEGGTGFAGNNWNKGDALYEAAVASINNFTAKYGTSVFAILWHQGESDVVAASATYEADLDQFLSDIRSDLTGASTSTPIVLGELAPEFVTANGATGAAINAIIADTPNRVANTAVASASGLVTTDGTHFTVAGVKTLGERYAAALATLL